jgi:hypothetical protein
MRDNYYDILKISFPVYIIFYKIEFFAMTLEGFDPCFCHLGFEFVFSKRTERNISGSYIKANFPVNPDS